ncbi:hypothetical protein CROQUDRAFT_94210 [Cronartium quercuum f. sp. fusiforme G11]|uniref:Uncharacterized protein n=1 Tax=Cronartium quercuum f. sp. fusiforme G11 TaxID=708437 RepID=A0A9P6NE53_9BASI|nr:hypothetical protein CROQUDRAFT_94210 [Cronartium quercuum f. sp. fusiforme G11]
MQLTHGHIVDWARELAKGTLNVNLESPPTHLRGFVWESLNNSLKTLTSRGKITQSDLSNLMPFPPLYEYLKFSNIPDVLIPDILAILEDHGILSWTSLFESPLA